MVYDPDKFPNRNDVFGFAVRTQKNLNFIEESFSNGSDVHVVTQVICSLTGICTFPWERSFKFIRINESIRDVFFGDAPEFTLKKGKIDNFGDLLRIVRNSVSHGGVKFSSDSRELSEVEITLTERRKRDGSWEDRSVIVFRGDQLAKFCRGFLRYVERQTG